MFNHAFERLTGLKAQDVISRKLDILFPEEKREQSMQLILEAMEGKRWETVEIPILGKDGTVRTILWNSATLFDKDGKTAVATIAQGQDITDRKLAEEQIIELNNELKKRASALEAANKELESFSYSVSHDLREPLRTIDGFSKILQDEYSNKLDEEAVRLLNTIRGGTAKMAQLISDLLSFSRLGRQQMKQTQIDIAKLAEDVCNDFKLQCQERNIEFKISEMSPAWGDLPMLRQALVNLVSNAIKFTRPRDNAIIEIGNKASSCDMQENIYFVKDNGVGFEEKYTDKLFKIFQRLHSEQEFEGTGVGLALVQRIIARHGGRVWAEKPVRQRQYVLFYDSRTRSK